MSLSNSLIIIPTYNESKNILPLLEHIFGKYPSIQVLIIDDNSPDQTASLIENLQKNNSCLHLIKRSSKLGLGTAYIQGFKWALKDPNIQYIFQMDADFSHDPNSLEGLLTLVLAGNDLVVGSRYINGIRIINWPIGRLLLSYFAGIYTRFITRIPIQDPTGGLKCFKRKVLENIALDKIRCNGYSFQIEMNYKIWKKGFRIAEYPIIFYERTMGASKMNKKIVLEAVFAVIFLRLGLF